MKLKVLSLAVACILAAGCGTFNKPKPITAEASEFIETTEDLQRDLETFVSFTEDLIQETAEKIITEAPSDVRRNAVLWRLRVLERYEFIYETEPAPQALVLMWTESRRNILFLEGPAGQALFEEYVKMPIDSSRRILKRIETIARENCNQQDMTALRQAVGKLATQTPLTGVFEDPIYDEADRGLEQQIFSQALELTLLPVRSVTSAARRGGESTGIGSIPGSINNVANAVDDFPEELRWQAELLLLDLEDNDVITSSVLSVERIGRSSADLAATAKELPTQVEEIIRKTLMQFVQDQAEIRATITELITLAEKSQVTASTIQQTVVEAEDTAVAVEQAAQSIEKMIEAIRSLIPPRDPSKPAGEPFRILDYRDTAVAGGETAAEVRAVIQELREFSESDALKEVVDELLAEFVAETNTAIDEAERRSKTIIDYAFKRLVLLIVLAEVLFLLVFWLRPRKRKSEKE